MLWFYLTWPFLLALVPVVLKVKRLRVALLCIAIAYILSTFVVAFALPFFDIVATGVGDPQLTAHRATQFILTALFSMVLNIPLALTIFWAFRKLKNEVSIFAASAE